MTISLLHGIVRATMFAAVLAALVCFVPGATPAHANTITVTSKVDATGGPGCTLRDAITAANTNAATGGCAAGQAGLDTINFGLAQCNLVPCVIVLNSALPVVRQDLNINGAVSGALVTINGNNAVRIFELDPVAVNLSNLRLHFGSAPSGAAIQMASGGNGTSLTVSNVFFVGNHTSANGGAIDEPKGAFNAINAHFDDNSTVGVGGAINRSGGTLTVQNSTFISNTASAGGGAIAHRGDVTLTATIAGSSFAHNASSSSGGAIVATGSSPLNVSDSVFDDNSTLNSAGAIAAGSPINVTRSTFSNNRALGSLFNTGGGALVVSAVPSTATIAVTISDSVLSNNFTARNGGALALCNGKVLLTNVTVSGNTAKESGGGISLKAGLCPGIPVPEVKLNNVTITNNTADNDNDTIGDGGGIFRNAGTVGLQNSIVAGNFDTTGNAGPGTLHPDCSGTFVSQGFTLIGKNEGCDGFVDGTNGDKVGTNANPLDALLGALADNGGPTPSHALLAGSPALNAGNPLPPGSGGFACAATDQRGVPRPLGPTCDMGAFEAGPLTFLPLVLR